MVFFSLNIVSNIVRCMNFKGRKVSKVSKKVSKKVELTPERKIKKSEDKSENKENRRSSRLREKSGN